jgi:hypothetical protein
MMNQIDWNEYHRLVEEFKKQGLPDCLAKIMSYEKLKMKEVYSPFETINS